MKEIIDFSKHKPALSKGVSVQYFSENHFLLTKDRFNLSVNKDFHELFKLVNGNNTISKIREAFNEQFNAELDDQAVYQILYSKLGEYGILEGTTNLVKEKVPPNYLKLSVVVFSSETVSKATNYLGWLFDTSTIKFLLSLSLFIIFSTSLFNYSFIEYYISENLIFSVSNFFTLIILTFFSGILHELGHAAACSHLGAKHGGIGFGFYLLSPVLFADVSDAWRLNKYKRIIVNLGGIYFELIYTGLIICCSLLLGNTLYILAIILFLQTLLNLNPFLRTDGYWILSDYLDIPNLRSVSNQTLKRLIIERESVFTLKDWLLGLYASFSYVMITLFLVYILILNPSALIVFPSAMAAFFNEITNGSSPNIPFLMEQLQMILLPLFFYLLLFRFLVKWINKNNLQKLKTQLSRLYSNIYQTKNQ